MSIDLATISFPSQSAAAKFFRDMAWRYEDCMRINDTDAQHLAALLEWHIEGAGGEVDTGVESTVEKVAAGYGCASRTG